MLATFYLGRPLWWPEYESCRYLTVPTPPVFSYYYDPGFRYQPEQGLVWIIRLIELTSSTVFTFVGACRDETVVFTSHDNRTGRNRQGVLVSHLPTVCKCVYDKGLSWFSEGFFFDPVHSIFAVVRSAEVNWTGLCLLDKWFPYILETGEESDLPERHTAVMRKRPL